MIVITEAKAIGAMLDAIRAGVRPARPTAVSRIVSDVVKRGWAASYQIEDLLHDMGAPSFWTETDLGPLFGVGRQAVFPRPLARGAAAIGFNETSAADLAYLLISVERLGMGIDPSPIVEAVLPPLQKRVVLTRSELHVYWYAKEQHRMEPVTVESASGSAHLRSERLALSTGYKVDVRRDASGDVGSMTVHAPKHRRVRLRW